LNFFPSTHDDVREYQPNINKKVCDDNTYYDNYEEGGVVDESAAAGSKETKVALEKEIAELEKQVYSTFFPFRFVSFPFSFSDTNCD